jgi:hypothetical protein
MSRIRFEQSHYKLISIVDGRASLVHSPPNKIDVTWALIILAPGIGLEMNSVLVCRMCQVKLPQEFMAMGVCIV